MLKISERAKQITAICSLVTIAFGTFFFIDNRYVIASAFAQMEQNIDRIEIELEKKIVSDRLYINQERLWRIEDRVNAGVADPEQAKEMMRALEFDNRRMEMHLESLESRSR